MSLEEYREKRKAEYDASQDLSEEEKDELYALVGDQFETRATDLMSKYNNSIKVADFISGCRLAELF